MPALGDGPWETPTGGWVCFIGRCPSCKVSEEYISGLGPMDGYRCQDCGVVLEFMWGTR